MKIKSILAAGLLSFLLIRPVEAQTTTAPTSPLMAPIQQAATKLKALQPTGDPDFDYIFRMRLMAQGVIDMAKVAAAQGSEVVKPKAQAFVDAKQKELAEMETLQRQLRPTRPNAAYNQQQSQQIQAIILKMQPDGVPSKMTGKIDDDFNALLTEYTRDATDLSKMYLTYGTNATAKAIAQRQ